ncbi:fatty acyl-AMP ligase [Nocardia sp. NPDC050793]|uniref:fatty acyl-AMP ligase n=1 Tax=Nocardia sp. NPDC050793 TaxID=3155159 RepID=UPI0034079AEB
MVTYTALGTVGTQRGTLIGTLLARAESRPGDIGYRFLDSTNCETLTYREVLRHAGSVATALAEVGTAGDRVLVVCPPGPQFITAFLGCLLAGRIAVPVYVPSSRHSSEGFLRIARDCAARLAIAPTGVVTPGSLSVLRCDALPPADDVDWPEPHPDNVAFLQYTSGSTGRPKGVQVRYRSLWHNLELIRTAFGHTPDSGAVIWLPPHHDMGLIGGLLQPLHAGFPATVMSPMDFLTRPLSWLQTIAQYGATTSGGPNIAYDLCTRRIRREEAAQLDLSRWEVAFVGAEPINPRVLERFADHFAPSGFRADSFFPCYGLAESTLFVSGGPRGKGARSRCFSVAALESGLVRVEPGGRSIVSAGPVHGAEVAVVDPATCRRCPPDRVGEIWLRGPSVADTYWGWEGLRNDTFGAVLPDEPHAGEFLRTGDLGFVLAGELYLAGRHRELIVVRGRNFFPQDLERTVEESHPELRPGGCAAFSVEVDSEERVVIVQEVPDPLGEADASELRHSIREVISREYGLALYRVDLVPRGRIPKTTSGKIQRAQLRTAFVPDPEDGVAQ